MAMQLEDVFSPPERSAATVLLIATRPLGAPVTGRKVVLRTIVGSLVALGHRVVVAAFGEPGPDDVASELGARAVVWLPGPSLPSVARRALGSGRDWSLNELLWWHPAALDVLREVVQAEGVDLVVADGIRTTRYAEALGLPWFCDLDDLLSDRYESWADRGLRLDQVLGFRAPKHDAQLWLANRVPAAPVLRREAVRVRRRELEVVRSASGVSLISADEAGTLAARSGRDVVDLPMAVSVGARRDWSTHDPADRRLAFTGSLTWWPNLEAVSWWAQELHPELVRRGLGDFRLDVFGSAPESTRRRVSGDGVVLQGLRALPDLQRELADHPLLLVPQREAMGLTTKIIEAAMVGTVVLSTRAGVAGMAVRDRHEVLLFDDVDELEAQLRWATEHPEDLAAIARRAQLWAASHYSAEAVAARWRDVLQDRFPHLLGQASSTKPPSIRPSVTPGES